ncbi:hypothetical protein B0I35DRAFT_446055 [Stachybotrys elegans]|uniref:Uncharacterized protein n=1 Tax=Stachybotrys elegans TaxID=80388 RepID=A0A8K0WJC3_9HYPO|nr:hypothetical protein B0I35DRAFT_446055 [Stachybotrys elegans]
MFGLLFLYIGGFLIILSSVSRSSSYHAWLRNPHQSQMVTLSLSGAQTMYFIYSDKHTLKLATSAGNTTYGIYLF